MKKSTTNKEQNVHGYKEKSEQQAKRNTNKTKQSTYLWQTYLFYFMGKTSEF